MVFETNSLLYKKTMQIISFILYYQPDSVELVKKIEEKDKNKKILLYQALSLSQPKLQIEMVEEILKLSTKERCNIWAK